MQLREAAIKRLWWKFRLTGVYFLASTRVLTPQMRHSNRQGYALWNTENRQEDAFWNTEKRSTPLHSLCGLCECASLLREGQEIVVQGGIDGSGEFDHARRWHDRERWKLRRHRKLRRAWERHWAQWTCRPCATLERLWPALDPNFTIARCQRVQILATWPCQYES